jgi:hypothetical protein
MLCHTNMIFLSLSLLTWHKKTGVGTFKPRVYRLTLLDQAQVTNSATASLSFRFSVTIFSRFALAGGEGGPKDCFCWFLNHFSAALRGSDLFLQEYCLWDIELTTHLRLVR